MNPKYSNTNTLDVQAVKSAASGQEVEILQRVGGIPAELLDGKHHHCPHPNCSDGGGHDRFRHMVERQAGAVICNQCFNEHNGDFIAAIQWMRDCTFSEAVRLIGDYLGMNPADNKAASNYPTTPQGKPPTKADKPAFDRRNIVAEYLYTDADGQTVYKVMRDDCKNFMQCRPDPAKPGQWVWNLKGVERVPYQLPTLLDSSRHTVFIVEGEKDADNLNRLLTDCGIIERVATTSAGGVPSAKQWAEFVGKYELANKSVIVMPDNDDPGRKFGRKVCKAFWNAGCQSIKMVLLSEVKDVSDLIELRTRDGISPGDIFQEIETLCRQSEPINGETMERWEADQEPASPRTSSMGEPEPQEPCPVDVLPRLLKTFAVEVAAFLKVDPAFIVPAMLSAISGMMGRLFRIQLKPGYCEIPAIWTVIVAPSGTKKTPALQTVLSPIRKLQVEADRNHRERFKEYQTDLHDYEEQKRNRRKSSEPTTQFMELPEPPIPEQFLIDDVTTEALVECLENNPFGVTLFQDEIAGLLNGFDSYRGKGVSKDVSRYLSIFSGDPVRVNRKTGNKLISAETPALSICGGIQPEVLKSTLSENPHYFASGLSARFLFSMPKNEASFWSEAEISEVVTEGYAGIFTRLLVMRRSEQYQADDSMTFRLSAGAKKQFVAFYDANETEKTQIAMDAGRAAWAKLPGYAAKIALLFHVVERLESEREITPGHVSEKTMTAAIRLTNWFKSETVRILETVANGNNKPAIDCTRQETRILEVIEKQGGEATPRDIKRLIRSYQTPGGDDALEAKLTEMVKAMILETEYKQADKGRGKVVYRIRSRVDETGCVDSVDVDEIATFPGKNANSVNVNSVNKVKMSTWEPASVPLTRRPKPETEAMP